MAETMSTEDYENAILTGDDLVSIHFQVCCLLIRLHNQLTFFFHALDEYPAFVRTLAVPPPRFLQYWWRRWVSICMSVPRLTYSLACAGPSSGWLSTATRSRASPSSPHLTFALISSVGSALFG